MKMDEQELKATQIAYGHALKSENCVKALELNSQLCEEYTTRFSDDPEVYQLKIDTLKVTAVSLEGISLGRTPNIKALKKDIKKFARRLRTIKIRNGERN